jgi:hypothetical protein
MTASLRVLNAPRSVRVQTDARGMPVAVEGRDVETVREEWRVEEAWWTDAPVRRRYLEVVVAGGRVEVVFEDRRRLGAWYRQRG